MLRVVRHRYPSHTAKRPYTASAITALSWDAAPEDSVPSSRSLRNLQDALSKQSSSPQRVWTSYLDALNSDGVEKINLKTHQNVLRRCTSSAQEIRKTSKQRYLSAVQPKPVHFHEMRFRNIIRNIRYVGRTPARDDYHFILEQFAAVGHYTGSMHVYQEMKESSARKPDNVTFALVLQAIAHRLVVPERKKDRPETVSVARRLLKDILDDMQKMGIAWTTTNMDLTIRIMKHTSDEESFDEMLRLIYGVDVRYPDRPVLDIEPSVMLPFTTHTLNTVLDMYGRSGNVSKLVQAFEVLSVPLPSAQNHFAASFDSDDDLGVSPPEVTHSFTPPHAKPNTTSFVFLLRHISRADKPHLARHYLLQAMRMDLEVSQALRRNTVTTPDLAFVHAPRIALNRAMFVSVFGLSNRNKNTRLMRWVCERIPSVVRRKKADLSHLKNYIRHLRKQGNWPREPPSTPPPEVPTPVPSSSSEPDPEYTEVDGVRWRLADIDSVLAVDVERQHPPSSHPPKPIDLALHMRILQSDINELSEFHTYARSILARTIERVKDRLGRRVWKGKDIYLRTAVSDTQIGGKARGTVSKQKWREIVNYKPRYSPTLKRPPSHFYHGVIRQQYWYQVKQEREERIRKRDGLSSPDQESSRPNTNSQPSDITTESDSARS